MYGVVHRPFATLMALGLTVLMMPQSLVSFVQAIHFITRSRACTSPLVRTVAYVNSRFTYGGRWIRNEIFGRVPHRFYQGARPMACHEEFDHQMT